MCVDANVTRIILTVINCDPFEVFFVAIDGLKEREMRFWKYRRVFHTVVGSMAGPTEPAPAEIKACLEGKG